MLSTPLTCIIELQLHSQWAGVRAEVAVSVSVEKVINSKMWWLSQNWDGCPGAESRLGSWWIAAHQVGKFSLISVRLWFQPHFLCSDILVACRQWFSAPFLTSIQPCASHSNLGKLLFIKQYSDWIFCLSPFLTKMLFRGYFRISPLPTLGLLMHYLQGGVEQTDFVPLCLSLFICYQSNAFEFGLAQVRTWHSCSPADSICPSGRMEDKPHSSSSLSIPRQQNLAPFGPVWLTYSLHWFSPVHVPRKTSEEFPDALKMGISICSPLEGFELQAVRDAAVGIFPPWGVQACTLLTSVMHLPSMQLTISGGKYKTVEEIKLTVSCFLKQVKSEEIIRELISMLQQVMEEANTWVTSLYALEEKKWPAPALGLQQDCIAGRSAQVR